MPPAAAGSRSQHQRSRQHRDSPWRQRRRWPSSRSARPEQLHSAPPVQQKYDVSRYYGPAARGAGRVSQGRDGAPLQHSTTAFGSILSGEQQRQQRRHPAPGRRDRTHHSQLSSQASSSGSSAANKPSRRAGAALSSTGVARLAVERRRQHTRHRTSQRIRNRVREGAKAPLAWRRPQQQFVTTAEHGRGVGSGTRHAARAVTAPQPQQQPPAAVSREPCASAAGLRSQRVLSNPWRPWPVAANGAGRQPARWCGVPDRQHRQREAAAAAAGISGFALGL